MQNFQILCGIWALPISRKSGRAVISVRFVGGWGGLTPHWLKTTPTLVTENFCLGVGFDPPSPDPARPT